MARTFLVLVSYITEIVLWKEDAVDFFNVDLHYKYKY